MGPRLVRRGSAIRSPTGDSATCASMGPRLVRRGSSHVDHDLPTLDRLQWGRAWFGAEVRCRRRCRHVVNVSFNGAAPGSARKLPCRCAIGCKLSQLLQWGRAWFGAEVRAFKRRVRPTSQASMGPRLVRRGSLSLPNQAMTDLRRFNGAAPGSARKSPGSASGMRESSYELQWGRAWFGAEVSTLRSLCP